MVAGIPLKVRWGPCRCVFAVTCHYFLFTPKCEDMRFPFNDDDAENKTDGNIPPPQDPLLERMKNYILERYEPTSVPGEATDVMSTSEIYEAIGSLYRNEVIFTKNDLAAWMHQQGFSFIDVGKMRFEWLLKANKN